MPICCGSGGAGDFHGNVLRTYTINAPKETVYDAFVDHIWNKNNPFGIAPKLMDTGCEELDVDYPQRLLMCKQITEKIYSVDKYNQIKYTVNSWMMPTSEYQACVEFKDDYGSVQDKQSTVIEWSAQYNFRCGFCCCPSLFRKIMEKSYDAMGNSLKEHVESKEEK